MTRMTCARAGKLTQLYLDNQLSPSQVASLQRHLSGCAECRGELSALLSVRHAVITTDGELDLTPEAAQADLTDAIMRRIAVYETRKTLARPEFIPDFVPEWVGWRSVVASVALVALVVTALLGGLGPVANTVAHQFDGVVSALLSPGPDQVSWAVWLGGGLVALLAVIWFVRADASSQWRRAISERLPQLW